MYESEKTPEISTAVQILSSDPKQDIQGSYISSEDKFEWINHVNLQADEFRASSTAIGSNYKASNIHGWINQLSEHGESQES